MKPLLFAGAWGGIVMSETHEMYVRIVLEAPCQVGETCGAYALSYPCAGPLNLVGQEGDIYEFRSMDKTGFCSADGRDFFRFLPGGMLGYDSQGDYGHAIGTLTPQ